MVKKESRGPISKAIRNLCSSTLLDHIDKPKFKGGLQNIINEYEPTLGNIALQDIGMAMQAWIIEYAPYRKDKIWRLVDEVEPLIRQKFEKSANIMFR